MNPTATFSYPLKLTYKGQPIELVAAFNPFPNDEYRVGAFDYEVTSSHDFGFIQALWADGEFGKLVDAECWAIYKSTESVKFPTKKGRPLGSRNRKKKKRFFKSETPKKQGRPPFHKHGTYRTSIILTIPNAEWCRREGNLSSYINELIERDIRRGIESAELIAHTKLEILDCDLI